MARFELPKRPWAFVSSSSGLGIAAAQPSGWRDGKAYAVIQGLAGVVADEALIEGLHGQGHPHRQEANR